MKKLLALMMVLAMVFCAACAHAQEQPKLGLMELMGVYGDEWTSTINTHMKETHNHDAKTMDNAVYYNSLDALMAALDSGEVKAVSVNKFIAQHLIAHNPDYVMLEEGGNSLGGFSMMTLEGSTAAYDVLNGAIAALNADGTMEALLQAYIYGNDHDATVELPAFEGAETIRLAITGSLLPIDCVNEAGQPTGFTAALLAAIAEYAQVNIQPVLVDISERAEALTSGEADALFWVRSVKCLVEGCDGYNLHEKVQGGVTTEAYIFDTLAALVKK